MRILKAFITFLLVFIGSVAFADDVNLSKAVPTGVLGDWFLALAGILVGAVVAIKGLQIIIRLVKRAL